jgi:hypothetical protein
MGIFKAQDKKSLSISKVVKKPSLYFFVYLLN